MKLSIIIYLTLSSVIGYHASLAMMGKAGLRAEGGQRANGSGSDWSSAITTYSGFHSLFTDILPERLSPLGRPNSSWRSWWAPSPSGDEAARAQWLLDQAKNLPLNAKDMDGVLQTLAAYVKPRGSKLKRTNEDLRKLSEDLKPAFDLISMINLYIEAEQEFVVSVVSILADLIEIQPESLSKACKEYLTKPKPEILASFHARRHCDLSLWTKEIENMVIPGVERLQEKLHLDGQGTLAEICKILLKFYSTRRFGH